MAGVDLGDSWPLPDLTDLRDELLRAYAHPARGYHDTRHLAEVLERVDELGAAGIGFERTPVLLAAWFHDSVYDGERDAEERSAVWAEQALAGVLTAQAVAEVARLVRLTETHHPDADDANGSVLSDADRRYLQFAEAFERRFIGQGEDEDRSVYETLNLAWDLLSMLPPEVLIRVSEEELAKYHKWQATAKAA